MVSRTIARQSRAASVHPPYDPAHHCTPTAVLVTACVPHQSQEHTSQVTSQLPISILMATISRAWLVPPAARIPILDRLLSDGN
jgi:hypothetical protein